MQIKIISGRDEIPLLLPNEKIVHVAFRPSNKDIFRIVEACPKVEAIQLPVSYKRSLSQTIQLFLKMQKVAVLEGDVCGHRKDISEYRSVPPSVFEDIETMKQKRVDQDKIVHYVGAKYRLSPGFVEFVIKKGVTT